MGFEPFSLQEIEMAVEIIIGDQVRLEGVRVDVDRDIVLRATVQQIQWFLMGRVVEDQHVSWPATWWDAVKDRWLPRWLKGRFPPVFKTYDFKVAEIALRLPDEWRPRLVALTGQPWEAAQFGKVPWLPNS